VLAALAGLGIGWARGGRSGRLARLPLRAFPLLAFAVVLVLVARAPWTPSDVGRILTSLGYLAALGALWLNRARPWIRVVLLGTALNSIAILANGGRMPVSRGALLRLGGPLTVAVEAGADPRHIFAGPATPFGFLGDLFTFHLGRFGVVLSPGDLLMAAGIAGLVQAAMRGEDSHP